MSFKLSILLCLYLACHVQCHSWVACTDYQRTQAGDSNYYRADACKGFPRAWSSVGSSLFGEDRGFNYQGTEGQPCRDARSGDLSAGYTPTYPMATYTIGDEVCLAWPSKNHVADTCTNPYIPDTAMELYASGPNPTKDPSQSEFKQFLVIDWKANNGKGFQNCPKFCENMDKSLCWNCFTVSADKFTPGIYTFQWYWIFNSGSAPYTTCYEAEVISSTASGGASASATSASATSSASGAATSTSSSATSTSSSGSVTGTTSTSGKDPLSGNGDLVAIVKHPYQIPYLKDSTFTVEVAYSATGPRDIIVDILDTKDNWFGKAIEKNVAAGKGTLQMSAKVYNTMTPGDSYYFKAWIVEAGKGEADQGWAYELDRTMDAVNVGNELIENDPNGGGASTTGSDSDTGSASSVVASLATIFVALIAFLL